MTELQRLVRGRIEAAGSVRGAARGLGVDSKTILAALRGSTSNRKLRRVLGMEEVLCESQATSRVTPAFRAEVEARKLEERSRWHAGEHAPTMAGTDDRWSRPAAKEDETIEGIIRAAMRRERSRAAWARNPTSGAASSGG